MLSSNKWRYWLVIVQEGAEKEDADNNNEEIPDTFIGTEAEEKEEQAPVERPRRTSKYMTKYERARILGTRALQIRFATNTCVITFKSVSIEYRDIKFVVAFELDWTAWMLLWWLSWRGRLIHLR